MTTSPKTLDELLAKIDRDFKDSMKYSSETFEKAVKEAKSEFISAVTTEDIAELKSLACKIYDSTEGWAFSGLSDDPSVRQLECSLVVLADVAQRMYEIMKPKIEAEKLLETNGGRRLVRALYDRNYTFSELQMSLRIDYFDFIDALRVLANGELVKTRESANTSGLDNVITKYYLTIAGRRMAEKMFPELKLAGCDY
ncbi:MAG: hypothetical protein HYW88_01150 [Candidatus Sungbacteria bacterium]|nr:hypothetical protein [Candidatus Sungbacteria bacterium]